MRVLLAAMMVLFTTLPAAAKDPDLAGQWRQLPRDARMSYMTGAAAGARAFALTQPGTPLPARIRVDQAVTNMDHLSADPLNAGKPIMAVAYSALMHAQDKGIEFVERGKEIRDPQFDEQILFDRPWLAPINLDNLVPREVPGPKPTFAHTWFQAAQHQKEFFVEGFGDMVYQQCLDKYGETPSGEKCLKPLLPLPPDVVLAQMDGIYRDPRYANQPYDAVIRAALLKMSGDDWKAALPSK
ncbi:MAG: hypothetical protein ACOZEN_06430 [Thermodesulfobacteriota bacterium]